MAWFKGQFGARIVERLIGTPYSLDLLTAIAIQETFSIWGNMIGKLPTAEILKLCVGDTLDAPSRSAFPVSKSALIAAGDGHRMFDIAHDALVRMAKHVPSYRNVAQKAHKFCHGFGIFQYDLQHFKTNPGHFLNLGWHDFDRCLDLCVQELDAARRRAYGAGKNTLTDEEMVYVAIAYNRGSVNFDKKFKQGFKVDSGKFYGEYIHEYLQLAHTISPAVSPGTDSHAPNPLTGAGLF
jgi:hypothetical protein